LRHYVLFGLYPEVLNTLGRVYGKGEDEFFVEVWGGGVTHWRKEKHESTRGEIRQLNGGVKQKKGSLSDRMRRIPISSLRLQRHPLAVPWNLERMGH